MRYTKAQLEELLWRQLQHIEEQNEVVALLREQTMLLKLENEKLRAILGLTPPVTKPYPKQKMKKVQVPVTLANPELWVNNTGQP